MCKLASVEKGIWETLISCQNLAFLGLTINKPISTPIFLANSNRSADRTCRRWEINLMQDFNTQIRWTMIWYKITTPEWNLGIDFLKIWDIAMSAIYNFCRKNGVSRII